MKVLFIWKMNVSMENASKILFWVTKILSDSFQLLTIYDINTVQKKSKEVWKYDKKIKMLKKLKIDRKAYPKKRHKYQCNPTSKIDWLKLFFPLHYHPSYKHVFSPLYSLPVQVLPQSLHTLLPHSHHWKNFYQWSAKKKYNCFDPAT